MTYYLDEVGRKVRLDLGLNLNGNTEIVVHVEKPDGTNYEVTRVAVADITVDDEATGQISYETEAAYHDQIGIYYAQARVDGVPNTSDIVYSPIMTFNVEYHMTFTA